MLEIKVNIEATAPDLSAAIEKLAEALRGSLILSPGGVETRLSGVQATGGNPTNTPVSVTAESVPAVQTNAQPVVTQNAAEQVPAAQTTQHVQTAQTAQATQPQQQFMNPPVTTAPVIDLDTISRAGAALIDQGKTPDVLALLQQFGVPAVNLLDPSQYPAFAEGLKALGASI